MKTLDTPRDTSTSRISIYFNRELPEATHQISFSVNRLYPIVSDGQELYNFWGWSFFRRDPNQAMHERWVVLQSDTNTYFFRSNPLSAQESRNFFNMDLLDSGFLTSAIEPEKYNIGLVFKHQSNNAVYYVYTNKSVIRTEDQLLFDSVNSQP